MLQFTSSWTVSNKILKKTNILPRRNWSNTTCTTSWAGAVYPSDAPGIRIVLSLVLCIVKTLIQCKTLYPRATNGLHACILSDELMEMDWNPINTVFVHKFVLISDEQYFRPYIRRSSIPDTTQIIWFSDIVTCVRVVIWHILYDLVT
jgi:hypothetical protein